MATQADLDILDRAISSGTTEVHFQDRTVKRYTSIEDMLIARTALYNRLYPRTMVRQIRVSTSKGF